MKDLSEIFLKKKSRVFTTHTSPNKVYMILKRWKLEYFLMFGSVSTTVCLLSSSSVSTNFSK